LRLTIPVGAHAPTGIFLQLSADWIRFQSKAAGLADA